MTGEPNPREEHLEFSLMRGGMLYRTLLRAHLTDPSREFGNRRIIAAVLLTWFPLALLAALNRDVLRGVNVPFLSDFDTQVRLLISLPLLLEAESFANPRLRDLVNQFRQRSLVRPEDRQSFDSIIASVMRLRGRVTIEVLLMLFAFTGGYWLWRSQVSLHVDTWYATNTDNAVRFSWAGYWYAFISLPLVRFVLLRWYFRVLVWYVFLFRVSRLGLRLNPMHPDRAGGLGFVGYSMYAFAPMLVAQTILVAGVIANQIWHQGATLFEFEIEIPGVVVFLVATVALPSFFFIMQMAEAKRVALLEHGRLAMRYVGDFREKWTTRAQASSKGLLGNADIQSLADLAGGYEVVRDMQLLPFSASSILRLTILVALPLLPLALTLFPFKVLLQKLVKFLL